MEFSLLTEQSERIPLWCFYEVGVEMAIREKGSEAGAFMRSMVNKKVPFIFHELPDMATKFYPDRSRMFLPFPNCWIECPAIQHGRRGRSAVVIEDSSILHYLFAELDSNEFTDLFGQAQVLVEDNEVIVSVSNGDPEWQQYMERIIKLFLHHINTPHHGVYHTRRKFPWSTREKAKKLRLYPLAAVTEIVISQAPPEPRVIDQTGTGTKKCQHEVKAHKRVYHRGTPDEFEVLVPAHKRGDPALGIKKSRYRVEV